MLKSLKALAFLTAILAVLAAIWFAVFAGSGFLNIDTEKIDESYPVGEGPRSNWSARRIPTSAIPNSTGLI